MAYQSTSGAATSWQLVGTTFAALPGSYMAGIAASKGQTGGTTPIKLDNFKVDGTAFRLSDAGLNFSLEAFPNPFGNQLSYRLEGVYGEAQVRLLDMTGRVVTIVETLESNVSTMVVNTSELAAGMYLLEVTANGERKLVKVVKR